MNSLLLLDIFLRNGGLLTSLRPTLTTIPFTTITTITLHRATGNALRITLPSTPDTSRAAAFTTVVKLITSAAWVTTSAVETFTLTFATITIASRGSADITIALTVKVITVTVAIAIAVITAITGWRESTDLAVGAFPVCLGLAALCFVNVQFGGAADTASASSLAATAAIFAVTTVTVTASTISVSRFAVSVGVFVPLLKTAEVLFKRRLAKLIRFESLVFFVFLESRLRLFPGVGDTHRRLEALDARAQSINGPALVTIGSMLFIFIAANCFLLDTLEEELQNIRIDIRSTAVSSHN
jgi:hypothetical protein